MVIAGAICDYPQIMRRPAPNKRQSGFTLVELMLAIAIFGILLAIALPNFSEMIINQRVRSASSDLFATLLYARSEAIKRNATINVVRSGAVWEAGWSVQTSGTVTVLKRQDPYTRITVTTDPPSSTLAFGANGRPLAGATVVFMVYPTSSPNGRARCISLSLSGMPTVTVDTDTNKTNGC